MLSPDGIVTPDYSECLPGRGAWVCADQTVLASAIESRAFSKSFQSDATVPSDLLDSVDFGLTSAALSALGLARKAGDLVLGFDGIIRQLKRKTGLAILVMASDASANGRRQLYKVSKNVLTIAEIFTLDQMSRAVGGGNVVYAGLLPGHSASRFSKLSYRLINYRSGNAAFGQNAGSRPQHHTDVCQ